MGFAEIIGHAKQITALRHALTTERVHHAYLFVGPEGVGKRTVAFALAQTLHCKEAPGDFCGACTACVRVQNRNHPDVRLIEPLPGKKEISIQQVRQIEKELSYRSFSGGRKIAIIDPATLMNWPAQNALLKTLEEPPENSLIVLIAANSRGLLPTVRSRCLPVLFAPLSRDRIAHYLTQHFATAPEDAKFVASLALGSLGTALRISSGELLKQRQSWMEMLASLKPADYRGVMSAAEAVAGERDETLRVLEWTASWCRDLVVDALGESRDDLVNIDQADRFDEDFSAIGLERLLWFISQNAEARRRVQRNVNRRMIVEDLLFGLFDPH